MAPPATISHTHHEPPNPSDNNDRPIPTTKTTSKNGTYRGHGHGHGHHHAAGGGGGSIYSDASFSSSSSIMPCANQGEEEEGEVAAVEGLVHSEARLEARLVTQSYYYYGFPFVSVFGGGGLVQHREPARSLLLFCPPHLEKTVDTTMTYDPIRKENIVVIVTPRRASHFPFILILKV